MFKQKEIFFLSGSTTRLSVLPLNLIDESGNSQAKVGLQMPPPPFLLGLKTHWGNGVQQSENWGRDQYDSENWHSNQYDSENWDSNQYDSENWDSNQYDSENWDGNQYDSENWDCNQYD